MRKHKVNVYDENGNVSERTEMSIFVSHLTRHKHPFPDGITYSFNTHMKNVLVVMDMVTLPPFSGTKMKIKNV